MAKREDLEFKEVSQTVKYPRQLDAPEPAIRTSAICLAKKARIGVLSDAVIREIKNAYAWLV
jgi:hypothetical protein